MKKKLLILGVVITLGVSLCGCALIDKITGKGGSSDGTKGVEIEKEETGGLYYLFAGEEVDASAYSIGDINYQGPSFGSVNRAEGTLNSFAHYFDKHILFVWFDDSSTASSSANVASENGKNILTAISTDAGFQAEGCMFNFDEGAQTETINNIERTMYTGTITAYDVDKNEMELPISMYSFVINGKPGCVLSVITADKDADTYKEEIENNTLVLMNTIVAK